MTIFVPRIHLKFLRLTWPRVSTCLRVQELKKLCFYLLSFQRYEAKSNVDLSFSQFSRIFSKLTIAHCAFMVPLSAFIFSGIVSEKLYFWVLKFWNFCHQVALATFVYFSLLAYFRHVPGWFPVVSLHEVHKLSPKMQGKE